MTDATFEANDPQSMPVTDESVARARPARTGAAFADDAVTSAADTTCRGDDSPGLDADGAVIRP